MYWQFWHGAGIYQGHMLCWGRPCANPAHTNQHGAFLVLVELFIFIIKIIFSNFGSIFGLHKVMHFMVPWNWYYFSYFIRRNKNIVVFLLTPTLFLTCIEHSVLRASATSFGIKILTKVLEYFAQTYAINMFSIDFFCFSVSFSTSSFLIHVLDSASSVFSSEVRCTCCYRQFLW